jgi:hypothetical protein
MQTVIEATTLPEASEHLNYPKSGPAVGTILGPNTGGEYLTVVSNEEYTEPDGLMITSRRVGLAYGMYRINGECTDPEGFPPEKAREWQARPPAPRIIVPDKRLFLAKRNDIPNARPIE